MAITASAADARHDDPVAYEVASDRAWAWRQTKRIVKLGAAGKILANEAPGYMVALRGLDQFLKRTDPVFEAPRDDGSPRVLAVNVILAAPAVGAGADARAALPAGGVAIHLAGGNGDVP